MLDTAIIDGMNHALAFRPPAVTQDIVDVRAKLDDFRTSSRRRVVAAQRQLKAWIRAGGQVRSDLRRMVESYSFSPAGVEALTKLIDAVERRVAEDGKTYDRVAKAYARQKKEAAAISPAVEAVVREVASASLRLLAIEALERAEFSTFLRALRAEYDPAGKGGPVFDDADELRRYIESATA